MNLGIIGGRGRMGTRVRMEAEKDPDIEEIYIIDLDTGNFEETLKKVDVYIDFSRPGALKEYLPSLATHRKALVSGTTGFSEDDFAMLREFSRKIPIFYSPNMSVGVFLITKMVEILSEMWEGDIEILEIHHRFKEDSPSGTAKKLFETIRKKKNVNKYYRKEEKHKRKDDEVGIAVLRGGDTVGEHSVIFFGDGERIEITHRAMDRRIFALGAIKAAKFVKDKPPGLYGMEDMFNL